MDQFELLRHGAAAAGVGEDWGHAPEHAEEPFKYRYVPSGVLPNRVYWKREQLLEPGFSGDHPEPAVLVSRSGLDPTIP